jgi:hypothetical protein
MTSISDLPVGTIAANGRDIGPFQGTPAQFPGGWTIPDGRVLRPDQHDHPKRRGQSWTLPDLTRQIVIGTSTHIESHGDDQGKMGKFLADNPHMPGEYPLIKVRNA